MIYSSFYFLIFSHHYVLSICISCRLSIKNSAEYVCLCVSLENLFQPPVRQKILPVSFLACDLMLIT